MKNSNDTIGNRTSDLLTCSAVPQPTAPPRSQFPKYRMKIILGNVKFGTEGDEKGDLITESHSILTSGRNHFSFIECSWG